MSRSGFMELMRKVKQCCEKKESELCRKLRLNASQFNCLVAFPTQGELGVNQLSEILGLSSSRTSRITDSLVKGGLLTRETPGWDRRAQIVRLTAAGLAAKQAIEEMMSQCEREMLKNLSEEQTGEIRRALEMLLESHS